MTVNTCSSCVKEWTGTSRCHCSGCHETFSGITTFDSHRVSNTGRGKCKSPNHMGLEQNEKGVWSIPHEEVTEDEDE